MTCASFDSELLVGCSFGGSQESTGAVVLPVAARVRVLEKRPCSPLIYH